MWAWEFVSAMQEIWTFISDSSNRAILSWIGGGAVVVFGGLWSGYVFLSKKPSAEKPYQSPSVNSNSINIEGSVKNSSVKIEDKK